MKSQSIIKFLYFFIINTKKIIRKKKSLKNLKDEFSSKEKDFLKKISNTYRSSIYHNIKREIIIETFKPFITKFHSKPNRGIGLQLGCSSDGIETEMLSKLLRRLDVLEGSIKFIKISQEKNLPNVQFLNILFEEFKLEASEDKYDFVFCTYVLEHVIKTEVILEMIKSVLKPNGLLFIVVPNCRACSRQLALYMGLIPGLKELTENDNDHGHRRVYDRISLNKDIEKNGFQIIQQGGIIFKILADFQLDKLIEEKILNISHFEGLYKLGLEYPDFSDSLYAICCLKL